MKRHTFTLHIALAVVLSLTASLAGLWGVHVVSSEEREKAFRDVGIQLFQWPWTAVARECSTVLGPMGIRRVLVSSPAENLNIPTWMNSYAPVSYRLNSALGSRREFTEMVQVCRDNGVDIIVDAVLNHMAPAIPPYRGIAGSSFSRYNYPGIYSSRDFHHCTLTPDGTLHDFRNRSQVQECNALGLPDLDTSSSHVQEIMHEYLQDLLTIGVAGFRIDAAKHIAQQDIKNILSVVPQSAFVVQEVIPGAGEPIRPHEYFTNGRVFDFAYPGVISKAISNGNLDSLFQSSFTQQEFVPRRYSVPIITNHDLERDVPLLSYRDGWRFYFAHALMLAMNTGAPFLYSGYTFTEREQPAPLDATGHVLPPHCAADAFHPHVGEFVCLQRMPALSQMVRWRRAAVQQLGSLGRHTAQVPVLAPARIIVSAPGVLVFSRNGLLFAANSTAQPITVDISQWISQWGSQWNSQRIGSGKYSTASLHSLFHGNVTYATADRHLLKVAAHDIVISSPDEN